MLKIRKRHGVPSWMLEYVSKIECNTLRSNLTLKSKSSTPSSLCNPSFKLSAKCYAKNPCVFHCQLSFNNSTYISTQKWPTTRETASKTRPQLLDAHTSGGIDDQLQNFALLFTMFHLSQGSQGSIANHWGKDSFWGETQKKISWLWGHNWCWIWSPSTSKQRTRWW